MKPIGNGGVSGASEFSDFDKAWDKFLNLKAQEWDVSLSFLRKGATNAVTIREHNKVAL